MFSLFLENFRISLAGNISFFKQLFTEKRSLGFRGLRMPHWRCSFIPKFIFLLTILSLAALFVEVNFVRNEHHVLKIVCTCVGMFAS